MEPIELRLIGLLESGKPVTVSELGGFAAFHQAIDVIANSRLMDEFFYALVDFNNSNNDPKRFELVSDMIINCFTKNSDPIALRNAIEFICNEPGNYVYTFDFLLKRVALKSEMAMIRGYFLLGAFEIAVTDASKKYQLISYLITVEANDDLEFLKYAAKITGLSYTTFIVEDLADKLTMLVNEQLGEDDAIYEYGMCLLSKALNSATQTQCLHYFDLALSSFDRAAMYGRNDADIYSSAIRTLKGFFHQVTIGELQTLVDQFKRSLSLYVLWENYSTNISWVNLRYTEIFYWYQMSDYLARLLMDLKLPAWLEPITVIQKYLLNIYDCSRSIFKRKSTTGLELLVRPVITARFLEQPDKVFLLEQWLKLNSDQEVASVAQLLRTDIESFKYARIPGNGNGAASNLIADAVPSIALLTHNAQNEFEKFVATYRTDQTTGVSLVLKKKFNELVDELKVITTYNLPQINKEFNSILFHTLKFLELRMDNTVANHPKVKYLFENNNLPTEDILQNDYFEFMQTANLNGKIRVEQMDVAGGRADVYFEHLSFSFCTEVKRELKDASFESLKTKYLGQAKEYQNTTAKVGILMVLDLLPKNNGIGSFENNIRLEITSSTNDPEPRAIVVIKVPGNRFTPSSIKLK